MSKTITLTLSAAFAQKLAAVYGVTSPLDAKRQLGSYFQEGVEGTSGAAFRGFNGTDVLSLDQHGSFLPFAEWQQMCREISRQLKAPAVEPVIHRARRNDPATSKDAARQVKDSQLFVLRWVARRPDGMTSGELESITGYHNGHHRRLPELEKWGFLRRDGSVRTSPHTGRKQAVWFVTQKGYDVLNGESNAL